MALRKSILLPAFDDEVEIDIDFRVLAVVERVYNMRAEYVASLLEIDHRILRHQVADVIVGWFAERTDVLATHKRADVLEHVMTAPADVFRRYVGAIQGAILFSLRQLSEEDLGKLARGEDLGKLSPDEDESKKKSEPH